MLRIEVDRLAARRSRQDAIATAESARQARLRAQQMSQDDRDRRARMHDKSRRRSEASGE
jgi:hypothetical protein